MQLNTFMKYAQWVPVLGFIVIFLYIWYGDFTDCVTQAGPFKYIGSIFVHVLGSSLLLALFLP